MYMMSTKEKESLQRFIDMATKDLLTRAGELKWFKEFFYPHSVSYYVVINNFQNSRMRITRSNADNPPKCRYTYLIEYLESNNVILSYQDGMGSTLETLFSLVENKVIDDAIERIDMFVGEKE